MNGFLWNYTTRCHTCMKKQRQVLIFGVFTGTVQEVRAKKSKKKACSLYMYGRNVNHLWIRGQNGATLTLIKFLSFVIYLIWIKMQSCSKLEWCVLLYSVFTKLCLAMHFIIIALLQLIKAKQFLNLHCVIFCFPFCLQDGAIMAVYFFKFFYFLVPLVGWGWAFFYYEAFRYIIVKQIDLIMF